MYVFTEYKLDAGLLMTVSDGPFQIIVPLATNRTVLKSQLCFYAILCDFFFLFFFSLPFLWFCGFLQHFLVDFLFYQLRPDTTFH